MKYIDVLRARVDALTEQRAAAVAEMESAVATAEQEQRSALTADETAAFDAAKAKIAGFDGELTEARARITELEAIGAAQTTNTRRAPIPGTNKPAELDLARASSAEIRGAARTLVEQSRSFAADSHREAVTELLDRSPAADEVARRTLATANDDYFRAWARIVTGQQVFDPDEQRALQRAMTAGTGSSGGHAVPTPIDPTMIITGAGVANPVRRLATVRQFPGDGLVWKGVTAAQVSASFDSEAAEVSDDSPTLSQPILTTVMARLFVPYSIEASMDIPGLTNDLAMLFADAKNNLEGGSTGFWSGSGSGQPYGVFTEVDATTASRVSSATGSTYAVADVYSVQQGLPARHRYGGQRLAWAMNVKTINSTRQFATANNYHGFLVDLGSGQPSQLLGDTLVEASAITSTVTTGNSIILYGDFSKFLILDKIGLQTEAIPHMFNTSNNLPSGQRGIFAWYRTGSRCLDVDAFRTLRL